MTKPYPEGTVFVSTPPIPGTKEQPPGAGYSPIFVPYPNGANWLAPGYANVQPAGGGPRVIVSPTGDVLVEVVEPPPPMGTTPIMQSQTQNAGAEEKPGGGLLILAIAAALLFAGN